MTKTVPNFAYASAPREGLLCDWIDAKNQPLVLANLCDFEVADNLQHIIDGSWGAYRDKLTLKAGRDRIMALSKELARVEAKLATLAVDGVVIADGTPEWPIDAPQNGERLSWHDVEERRRLAATEASAVVPGTFMDGLPPADELQEMVDMLDTPEPDDDNAGFDDIGGPGVAEDTPYIIKSGSITYSTSGLIQLVKRSNLDPHIAAQVEQALERGVQARLDLRRIEHITKGRMAPVGCASEEPTDGDEAFHAAGAYVGEG